MKKIESITIKSEPDYDNDLSYIGEYTDSLDLGNIVIATGQMITKRTKEEDLPERGREFRAFKPYAGGEKYGSKYYKKYALQDFAHIERIDRGDVSFIGIRAVAEVHTSRDGRNWHIQEITGGSLWGIESDSGESYFKEIGADCLSELVAELEEFGFTTKQISAASVEYNFFTVSIQ